MQGMFSGTEHTQYLFDALNRIYIYDRHTSVATNVLNLTQQR